MKTLGSEDHSKRMERLADYALLRIVTVEASDYRSEVLGAARAELRQRDIELPTPRQFLQSLTVKELQDSDLFCVDCYDATTDDRCPIRGEMIFRRLMPAYGERCSSCGSVVREYRISWLGLPLYRLASYRVKELIVPWPGRPKLISSRKLRESAPGARTKNAVAAAANADERVVPEVPAPKTSRSRSRWAE